jgi:hypothetical protein
MRFRHFLGVSWLFVGRLAAFGLLALALPLTGCGGGGGGSGSGTTNFGPGISITSPTTDPTFSQVCNSQGLIGGAGFGKSAKCCNGTAEELTGVRVTWTNAATGTTGQAFQSVQLCPFLFLCNHTWSAFIPLVLGDNQITVTASDTATGAASTETITINKPILTYTVSGTFSSHLGAPPGNVHSQVTRVGADGSHSVSISPSGSYAMSCMADGTYTLTPTSTKINYVFTPANLSVTVAGADVIGQNFTATAFLISGSVTFASNGAGVEGQAISLSGSGSMATSSTASGGSYSFLVPNGTYTLTPTDLIGLPQQTTPPSRTVTVNNADVPAQDFVR